MIISLRFKGNSRHSTTSFKLTDFHLGLHFPNVCMDRAGCQRELSSHHGQLVGVTLPRGNSSFSNSMLPAGADHGLSESRWALHGTRCNATFPIFSILPHECLCGFRGSPTSMHNCSDWCLKTIYANVHLSSYMNICINTCMNHKNNLVKSETMSHN